ncbi:DUF4064 domain-containing protein [Halothermothrix orenii]|uniref:DUF4064 domain-containing protein n=1 Tax=Halothermothrix orenii (strain H 168 / OCM 544 / DSM 9562) TaxID=373903 RepID=B8D0X9_HALOH|nr:DUF4064 domain-containing protein [Halothermothrix orenii]ACL68948.1 hypothetical protein Hore_01860 [Halothermothrix orenii H 168]
MSEGTKEVSSAPLILGIIGGVLGIPASFCAGACAGFITAMSSTAEEASAVADFYMWVCLIGAVLGLIFAIRSKKSPKSSGIVMIIAAVLTGFTVIAGNGLALIAGILFLIAGILSINEAKKVAA